MAHMDIPSTTTVSDYEEPDLTVSTFSTYIPDHASHTDGSVQVDSSLKSPRPTTLLRPIGGPHTDGCTKAKRKSQWMLSSVLLGLAALGLLALGGLYLPSKRAAERQLVDVKLLPVQEVVEKLLTNVSPDCFLKHKSFTSDTPEAEIANRSIYLWLRKACKWLNAAKEPTAYTPESWEIAILRGALVCSNIPHLEATAALAPYDPCAHGFSRENYVCGKDTPSFPEEVEPESEERLRVKEAKEELRKKKEKVVSWIREVREHLAVLAANASETSTQEKEALLNDITRAQQFYKYLYIYAKAFTVPADNVSLKVLDSFVFQRDAAAAKAVSALTRGDLYDPADPPNTNDTADAEEAKAMGRGIASNVTAPSFGIGVMRSSPAIRAQLANNRFVPPWLVHMLLGPRNMTPSATVWLRLAVNSSGLPFTTKDTNCLSEFNKLLQDTLEFHQDYKILQSLPRDSPERKEKQRQLRLLQMHVEVAVAAFKIPRLEERISEVRAMRQVSHELRSLTIRLTASYENLGSVATRWLKYVGKGELDLTPVQTEELTMVLKNLVNVSFFSKTLASMRFRAHSDRKFVEQASENIRKTAGLAGIAEVHLMISTKNLNNRGIVPAWWAHLR